MAGRAPSVRGRSKRLRQIDKEFQHHRFGRRAETLPMNLLELGLQEVKQGEAAEIVQA